MIARTMRVSNRKDYSAEYIEDIIRGYSPASVLEMAEGSRFYVACDEDRIIGCGSITAYDGSKEESYLQAIFVLPEYQGLGIGRLIVETLEKDEYFLHADRTLLRSSITAAGFYSELGYVFCDGNGTPDEHGVIRMEKRNVRSDKA